MIYLFTFILLLIPVIRFDLMQLKGNKQLWLYLEFFVLVLIAGIRYRVGGDTIVYMDHFEGYPTISELSTFDFENAVYNRLWYIYNSVFKSLGDSFTLFQIVQALIVNTVFFRFFKRYSPFYFTAILVYFWGYYCYFNMEIQREVLAICVLLESYYFLQNKKFIIYYLLCVLAMFFHTSAVIMFFIPLVYFIKKDYYWVPLLIIILVVLSLKVFNVITIFLSIAIPDSKLTETIAAYLLLDSPNIIGQTIYILKVVPFILIMFVRNKYGYNEDSLMGRMLFFSVAIQSVTMYISVTQRFSNYIYPFGIIFVVNTVLYHYWDIKSHLLSKIIVNAALFIYLFNLSYFYLQNRYDDLQGAHVFHRYIPYNTVFNKKSNMFREQLMQNERADN